MGSSGDATAIERWTGSFATVVVQKPTWAISDQVIVLPQVDHPIGREAARRMRFQTSNQMLSLIPFVEGEIK
jgi:hypothetical protein